MDDQLLYKKLAKYYDLIYSWKDYGKEVARLKSIIRKFQKSSGNRLLEVACGSGHHLEHFAKDFRCMGSDLNAGMLTEARKKLKGMALKKADMIRFDFGKKFNVILCLFSYIGYVRTYANLKKTLVNFAHHLKPGGVLIIEPWFAPEAFHPGTPWMSTYDGKTIKIARLCVSRRKGGVSISEMHYLIAEKGKGVCSFVDRHAMGLFTTNRTLSLMKAAGLKASFLKNGLMKDRGLFVATKES